MDFECEVFSLPCAVLSLSASMAQALVSTTLRRSALPPLALVLRLRLFRRFTGCELLCSAIRHRSQSVLPSETAPPSMEPLMRELLAVAVRVAAEAQAATPCAPNALPFVPQEPRICTIRIAHGTSQRPQVNP
jgi:hypothetical protein